MQAERILMKWFSGEKSIEKKNVEFYIQDNVLTGNDIEKVIDIKLVSVNDSYLYITGWVLNSTKKDISYRHVNVYIWV